jgi:hypothetical protein
MLNFGKYWLTVLTWTINSTCTRNFLSFIHFRRQQTGYQNFRRCFLSLISNWFPLFFWLTLTFWLWSAKHIILLHILRLKRLLIVLGLSNAIGNAILGPIPESILVVFVKALHSSFLPLRIHSTFIIMKDQIVCFKLTEFSIFLNQSQWIVHHLLVLPGLTKHCFQVRKFTTMTRDTWLHYRCPQCF